MSRQDATTRRLVICGFLTLRMRDSGDASVYASPQDLALVSAGDTQKHVVILKPLNSPHSKNPIYQYAKYAPVSLHWTRQLDTLMENNPE